MNKEGALAMATLIDNSGLYSGLNQAEVRIDQFGNYVKKTGDKIGMALTAGFGGAVLKNFASEIINVRGEMQMLESSFEVLLGGKGVSGFMSEMKQFAVDSPLSLSNVGDAAQMLLAFGVEANNVMSVVKQLGDISMGNSAKFQSLALAFSQMTSAGRVLSQDLRQMATAGFNPLGEIARTTGKSIQEVTKMMDDGQISVQQVTQAFASATAEGGKFYGMTQKQAEGIRGLQAQLEGGLQDAFNEIGQSQEGLIAGGYKVSIALVENYDKVGKAIVGLIASYGTYKAALVFVTQAEAGWNVVQLITYNRLLLVEKAQKLLNATMLSNPYVLLATVTVGLVASIWLLHDATTTQEKAQERLNKLNEEAAQRKQDLESKTSQLTGVINSETKTIFDQIVAYQELQGLYPKYLANMDRQTFKALGATQQQKLLNEALNEIETINSIAQVEALEKKISEMQLQKENSRDADEILNLGEELRIQTEILNGLKEQKKQREENLKQAQFEALSEEEKKKIYKEQLSSLEKQKSLIESQIPNVNGINTAWNKLNPTFILLNNQLGDILSKIADTRAKLEDKPTSKNKSFWEKEKKDAEDALALMDESAKGSAEWKKQLDKLNTSKVKLGIWDFSGKSQKSTESAAQKMRDAYLKVLNTQAELDNESVKQQLDHEQKLLDIEQDSFYKRYRQNQLNLHKESQSIKEYRQKMAKDQQDAAKDIYVSKNGTDTGFNFASYSNADLEKILPKGLKPSDIDAQVKNMTDAIVAAYKKGNEDLLKERAAGYKEQELLFASSLDQQLASIDAHYAQEIKMHEKDEEYISKLQENHLKERALAKEQYNQKLIQMENEYKEKVIEFATQTYLFQSDKDAALLKQKIANNEKYTASLKEEFKKLTGKNFDSLTDSELESLFKKYPELVQAIKKAVLEQKSYNNELSRLPAKKLNELIGLTNKLSNAIGNISGFDLSVMTDSLSGISDLYSTFSDLKESLKTLTGANATKALIGGGVDMFSIASNVASGIITSIISKKEQEAAIQRELNSLQQQYNIDLRQQNYDLISSIDYARAFRDNIEALNWLVEKGFISDKNYSAWDALYEHWKVAKKNAEDAGREYEKVNSDAVSMLNGLWNNRDGLKASNKQAVNVLKEWKDGTLTVEQALEKLAATGLKDSRNLLESLQKLKDEGLSLAETVNELSNQMDEFATGTDFDSFLGDAMSAITDMKAGISDLGDFTEDTLKNAVLSSFKYKVLASALEPLYNQLANLFIADDLDKDAVVNWGKKLEEELKKYADKLGVTYDLLGLDFDKSDTQASSKGIQSVTQDSFDEYLGTAYAQLQKMGDIRNINEASRVLLGGINNGVTDIQAIMRENNKVFQDSLEVQRKIEQNTLRTAEAVDKAVDTLNRIDTIGVTIRN